MADSQDALRLAYQRELDYLRRMGARFAGDHPKIASRLQLTEDRAADPHVERLLESFAFLTARVQKGFEDELPEVTTQLLGLLYPHLVEPVPSLAIARFEVDPQRKPPASGHAVPRHTLLYAETEQGHTCRFRTCYPVTLWPVELTEVRLESTSRYDFLERRTDVAAVLRLRLEARGASFSELELERLPLYLGGERRTAHTLYELLTCNLRGVVLVSDPDGHTRAPVHLPVDSVRPLGFGRDEEVLPAHPQSHAGHRLLQEYFAFPDKFLFFELVPGNAHVRTANRVLDVLLLLDALPQGHLALTPDSFSLGCTPIANLFPKTTEPIRIDHQRTEYPLVPDLHRERTMEIHSVLSVSASSLASVRTREVEPFFSFRHPALDSRHHRAFWYARRRPTGRADLPGTELLLTFLDLDFRPHQPADEVLFAHTLCTNRDLAAQLPPGHPLQMEDAAPLRGISCLTAPTAQVEPPLGGPTLWKLVSLLSLNHLSLSSDPRSLEALCEVLRLHDVSPQAASEQQVRGLLELRCRETLERMGTDAWRGFCRGQEVTLVLDEAAYVGGSAVLLGAVLSRFLGLYAAVNSFTRLVMKRRKGADSEVWKRWPAMAGEQAVL